MTDEHVIEPESRTVLLDGEPLQVKPVTVGRLPRFLRAIKPVLATMQGEELDLFAAFADHGEQVIEALSIATGLPVARIEVLELDAALDLARAVIEVNLDFFARRVTPAIAQLTTVAGPTP